MVAAERDVAFGRPATPKAWDKHLRAVGLSAVHAAAICGALRPAGELAIEASATRGGSKLGGWPDAPADFVWPSLDGEPCGFLCQLRLVDLPTALVVALALPRKGLVSIFTGGHTHSSRCVVVVFTAKTLVPAQREDMEPRDEVGLAVSASWSPPPRADKLLGEDDDAIRIYDAALADYARAAGEAPLHRVGGYATPVHDPPEAGGERLLLQLDYDEAHGLGWGDNGRLFVLVTPGQLDAVRLVLED